MKKNQPVDISAYVTGFFAVLIVALVAFLILNAGNAPETRKKPWYGCEHIASVKTEKRRYCGKACSMPVYADTFQCGGEQKTWINARWNLKDDLIN